MKIYKYEIAVTDEQTISLPTAAKILAVQIQHGRPQIWALFDESLGGKDNRTLFVVGTGNPLPPCGRYIGTFQMMNGSLIWHVFEGDTTE